MQTQTIIHMSDTYMHKCIHKFADIYAQPQTYMQTHTFEIDIQKIKQTYPCTLIHALTGPYRYIYTEAHTFIGKYALRHVYIHSRICMHTYILPHT